MALTPLQVAAAASIGGFSGDNIVQAVQLAYALSDWNPSKANNDHYGLWQIKKSAHPDLFSQYHWDNPADNARMANVLFQKAGGILHPEGGWSAWNGAYNRAKYDHAKLQAVHANQQLRQLISQGKSAESILGKSRSDGSKTPEASIGGKVVNAAISANPLAGLFQANIWLRVAEVTLGLVLVAVGIAKLTNAVPAATKVAAMLA
jgi:Lysozyme like domain